MVKHTTAKDETMASKVAWVVEVVEGWLYRRSQMGRVQARRSERGEMI